jgi:hypothetical protein
MSDKPANSMTRPIIATIAQQTGKQYQALEREIAKLPEDAARDLYRLLQDLEGTKRNAVQRARIEPWRR